MVSRRLRGRRLSSYQAVVGGNSCDSTKDQLEAVVPPVRPAPAGVYVSAPLQETEGERGRLEDRGEVKEFFVCMYSEYKLENTVVL